MSSKKVISQIIEEKIAFRASLPEFIHETVENMKILGSDLVAEWFEKVMKYNVFEKKPYRGLMTVIAYKELADESQLNEENLTLVQFISWCSKMIEAGCIMADDIVDSSQSRLGVPCWHTLENHGLQSINDALLLHSAAMVNLQKRVGHMEYYQEMTKIIMEGMCLYLHGQILDSIHTKAGVLSHSKELYDQMTELKTGISNCYSPVQLALLLCGYKDPDIYKNAKEILVELGHAWQCRNDFLDCFGQNADAGGTDISENKMTWLSVNALSRANQGQKVFLQKHYGQKDAESKEMVKSLYEELGLQQLYLHTEKEYFSAISEMIEKSPYDKLKPVLRLYLQMVFKI